MNSRSPPFSTFGSQKGYLVSNEEEEEGVIFDQTVEGRKKKPSK